MYNILCDTIVQLPVNWTQGLSLTAIISVIFGGYRIIISNKRFKEDQLIKQTEVLNSKADAKEIEIKLSYKADSKYIEVKFDEHKEVHEKLEKEISEKASNEKVDMMLEMMKSNQSQMIRQDQKLDKIIEMQTKANKK